MKNSHVRSLLFAAFIALTVCIFPAFSPLSSRTDAVRQIVEGPFPFPGVANNAVQQTAEGPFPFPGVAENAVQQIVAG